MNKEQEPLTFDISKPEQARWLAILIAEFQSHGVNYLAFKDWNLVYVTVS